MAINTFRKARKRLGLTQQDLASRCGVSQNAISDLETGRNTNPTWQVLSAVARVLESTPEQLLPQRAVKKSAAETSSVSRELV